MSKANSEKCWKKILICDEERCLNFFGCCYCTKAVLSLEFVWLEYGVAPNYTFFSLCACKGQDRNIKSDCKLLTIEGIRKE